MKRKEKIDHLLSYWFPQILHSYWYFSYFTNKQFLSGNQNLKKKKTDIYSNVLRLFTDFMKQWNGVFATSSNFLIFMSLQSDGVNF